MSDNRRTFLRKAALGGGAVAFAAGYSTTGVRLVQDAIGDDGTAGRGRAPEPEFRVDAKTGALTPNPNQQVSYTACLGCTTMCGVRVRIDKASGAVLRVSGNPYSPLSTDPHLPFKTSVRESFLSLTRYQEKGLAGRSTTCGRGNAVAAQMDSPFRLLTPLKRVGPRNGGRWEPIAFEQLVKEISEGGDLFGEGHIEGLRSLRDLATPIDALQPGLGPKVNQVALLSSLNDGREAFARRFMQKAYGTINFVGHGAYCGGAYRSGSGAMFGDMKKMPHAKPDLANAEFCLYVGTAPGNAGNPFKRQGKLLAKARTAGKLKYVVIDPVLTHADNIAAEDRSRWIPIRPGTDGALAMAMMRWMIDNERCDTNFLSQPSAEAAQAAGEAGWCNATHLVISETGHARDGRFLRGSDIGMAIAEDKRYGDEDPFVVAAGADGALVAHNAAGGPARLWHEGRARVGGEDVGVHTSMALLREQAHARSMEDYAAACGIPADTIAGLAREFTSHGKKAVVNVHGGTMTGNGFYNAYALVMLNTLIGNINRRGGLLMNGGGFRDDGAGPRYDLENFPDQVKPAGIPLGRNVPYEKTAEFQARRGKGSAYPARAPWFPNAPQLATEWFGAAMSGYPYALKALLLWSSNPVYGIPGLRAQFAADLADPKKLPLIVAIDPFINESSAYADYIVPDSLLYESWGWAAAWNGVPTKCATARWPVVEPRAARTPAGEAIGMETFFIALAKAMALPGFGEGALADAEGKRYPLDRPEDWYLRGGANIAWLGKEPVPDANDEDIALSGVERLRARLTATLKPEEWRKVAYILARGGRYQPYKDTYAEDNPDWATHRHPGALQVYNENVGTTRNSLNGKRYAGTPTWTPPAFADGTPVRERYAERDWPLQLVSFKSPLHNSYSMGAARLRKLRPENPVAIHPEDARRYGLVNGDIVDIATPAGSAQAHVVVRNGVMPGVLAVEHGYGHRELGARAHRIGANAQPDVSAIGRGFNLNDVGLADPTRAGRALWVDPVAGSAVRNGLPARIAKA